MTRDEAITRLKNMAWLYGSTEREQNIEAIDMAIEALKADVARWSSWNKTFEQSGIADLISRADAIKAVEQEYKIDRGYMVDDYTYGFNQAIHYVSDIILQDLPSADAVEVVRCKDCKHYLNEHICLYFSRHGRIETSSYAYCAYGERREP